ncbi:hypothetical protein CHRYSEO8AT_440098 [Chryseobacterium sp. 8AT]|nr:hypothetical protein CHRYSEO8AT_440098 [Chryseobacterium sp. 8AT]
MRKSQRDDLVKDRIKSYHKNIKFFIRFLKLAKELVSNTSSVKQ